MRSLLVFSAAVAVMLAFAQDEGRNEPQGCSATATLPCLELRREADLVTVQQTATDAEGGIFSSRTFEEPSACSEAGRVLTVFYAPAPKRVETRLGDTLVTSNAVLREQPQGDQDAATLELFGGTLELDPDTRCPVEVARSDAPEVVLQEGRTTVAGAHMLYDNASGQGVLTGSEAAQVTLNREAEGDSPALSALADRLEFTTDGDERTFSGGVVITAEDRVSEAETLLYNDATGIAVLRGSPATSRRGTEFVQGSLITYYLDSNDVVVVGAVNAAFEVDLDGASTPAPPDETDEDEPENPLE